VIVNSGAFGESPVIGDVPEFHALFWSGFAVQ